MLQEHRWPMKFSTFRGGKTGSGVSALKVTIEEPGFEAFLGLKDVDFTLQSPRRLTMTCFSKSLTVFFLRKSSLSHYRQQRWGWGPPTLTYCRDT